MINLFKPRWSRWEDISTGKMYGEIYLLQAKRHLNGKVKFRVEHVKGAWHCDVPTLERLKEIEP
jgi:hypothetical protein